MNVFRDREESNFATLSSGKIMIVGNLSRKPVFYEELFLCTFICTSIGTIELWASSFIFNLLTREYALYINIHTCFL